MYYMLNLNIIQMKVISEMSIHFEARISMTRFIAETSEADITSHSCLWLGACPRKTQSGMVQHWRKIMKTSDDFQSKHVLAWTWGISPATDHITLVPEADRSDLVLNLTDRLIGPQWHEIRGD